MLRYDEKASISKFSSQFFGNINAATLHINDNIKKARVLRNLTQDDIASKLGERRSTYAEWEKETMPKADVFWRLAAILCVRPEDLLSEGWQPDEGSSFEPVALKKKISLETIQKDLDNILHQQVWTRAEVRAYGQYPLSRDAQGDGEQVAKILVEIGRLAAVHAGNIAKENIGADGHN